MWTTDRPLIHPNGTKATRLGDPDIIALAAAVRPDGRRTLERRPLPGTPVTSRHHPTETVRPQAAGLARGGHQVVASWLSSWANAVGVTIGMP